MLCNKKIIKKVILKLNKYLGLFRNIKCQRAGLILNLEIKQKTELNILFDKYDKKELNFLAPYLSKDSIFLDIRANIGFYSLYLAKNTNAKVFAFEPDEYNIAKFKHNIELNNLYNISILNYAIADKDETQKLRIKPNGRGSNSLNLPKRFQDRHDILQDINCKRLITALTENNIDKVSCMKIDIEGYELFLVQDFFIEENKHLFPKAIVIEEWGHIIKTNGKSSIEYLIKAGYSLKYHHHDNFFLELSS
jgi:FkbM family methyltransferase